MGFFSDLKDDLSQAVNELLPEEAAVEEIGEAVETDAPAPEAEEISMPDLSEMLDKMEAMDLGLDIPEEKTVEETVETVEEEIPETTDEEEEEEIPEVEEEPIAEEIIEEKQESTMDAYMDAVEQSDKTVKRVATDETAVITVGMTVRGDVETEGSLELIGKVIGNIEVLGKLNITGSIEGNSKASEVYAEKAHIIGEIVSDGAVKIGQSSVIIGNVYGSSAVVAGAVKGDIDIKGPVILDSTAIVMGNIRSKSVQINNGAVIEGMCSQCYADVSPTTFFEEFKNV